MSVFTLGNIPVTNIVERTGTITPESGVTISNLRAKQVGKVVEVRFLATKSGGFGTSEINIGMLNGVDLPPQNIKTTCGIVTDIIIEDGNLTFTSGVCDIPAKSGYRLVNAYAIGRPTTEAVTSYGVAGFIQRTDATYRLQAESSFNAGLRVRRVWANEAYIDGAGAYCSLSTSGNILVRADLQSDTVIDVGIVYTVDSGITEGTTEIIDDLVTDNPLAALSARQGKVLDDKITSLENDSDSGYCKFPDGTLMCWKTEGRNNTGSSIPYTFPIKFISLPTVVITTGAGGERVPIYAEDVTTSGFNVYRTGNGTASIWIRWLAIGRWK